MPITEELKNVRKYESVGFTHEQAETLAESLELAIIAGNEDLKSFIQRTVKESENNLRNEIKTSENFLCGEMKDMRYDLLLKMITVTSSTAGLLFLAIKLFT